MNLEAIEREAVLTYDEESNQYHIYSSSSKEQTRLRKAGIEPYKIDSEGSWYCRVDRNQVSFRAKSNKKRELSPERRAALAENLAKGRANKKKLGEE